MWVLDQHSSAAAAGGMHAIHVEGGVEFDGGQMGTQSKQECYCVLR